MKVSLNIGLDLFIEFAGQLYPIDLKRNSLSVDFSNKRIKLPQTTMSADLTKVVGRGTKYWSIQENPYIVQFTTYLKTYSVPDPNLILWSLATNNFDSLFENKQEYNFNTFDTNVAIMPEFSLYLKLNENYYQKVTMCQVDSLSLFIDHKEFVQIDWKIIGKKDDVLPELPNYLFFDNGYRSSDVSYYFGKHTEVIYSNSESFGNYNILEAKITFLHNLTMLIPDELPIVNKPIGAITGPRSVFGSIFMYSDNPKVGKLVKSINKKDNHQPIGDMAFVLGDRSIVANTVIFRFFHAMMVYSAPVPNDIVAYDFDFHALPSSIEMENEAQIVAISPYFKPEHLKVDYSYGFSVKQERAIELSYVKPEAKEIDFNYFSDKLPKCE